MNLLETYRDYMARFNVAEPAPRTMERGLYIPRSESVIDEIAPRILLEPSSMHLLIGGIGSGKTTELFHLRERIQQEPDTHAFYIDVAQQQELGKLQAGVLVLLAALRLGELLPAEEHPGLKSALSRAAHGSWTEAPYHAPYDEDPSLEWTEGQLNPPGPTFDKVVENQRLLGRIRSQLASRIPHVVFLFDSLDRIGDVKRFVQIVEQDIAALRDLGIGAVLVGSLPTLYGPVKAVVQHFDHDLFLPDVDPADPGPGFDFLFRVLRARASETLLPDPVCRALVAASGGVLRDLIALAKAAGQRAFMAGAEQIALQHLEVASQIAGRRLLFGLDSAARTTLDWMGQGGPFRLVTDQDLELLHTRRVLQYLDEGIPRYVVHPLLRPLLKRA